MGVVERFRCFFLRCLLGFPEIWRTARRRRLRDKLDHRFPSRAVEAPLPDGLQEIYLSREVG